MSFRNWSVLLYVELWLVVLLATVDLALQFSSTILLSDMVSIPSATSFPSVMSGVSDVLRNGP